MPPSVRRLLIADGFQIREFPSPATGFLTGDESLFADMEHRFQTGWGPAGWWWSWLKLRLGELVDFPCVIYVDTDMLAVDTLDPLLDAAAGGWTNVAGFAAVEEVQGNELNTGILLVRTSVVEAKKLQHAV